MKMFIAFFCALFLTGSVFADIYSSAMRQARNVAGGGGNSAPDSNPSSPPPAPPQINPPPDPVLEATLKNISNLRVDFDALGKLSDAEPDSPQKKLLLNDLTTAAQGAKPSPVSILRLADDLAAAVAGKKAMQPQHAKLAQEVHAIFNISHLSAAQQQTICDGAQKILQDGGASPDDSINVVADLKSIANETK